MQLLLTDKKICSKQHFKTSFENILSKTNMCGGGEGPNKSRS